MKLNNADLCMLDDAVVAEEVADLTRRSPEPDAAEADAPEPDPDIFTDNGPGSVVESVARLLEDRQEMLDMERRGQPIFPPHRPGSVPSPVSAPRPSPGYTAPSPGYPVPHHAPRSAPQPSPGYPAPLVGSAPHPSPGYPVPRHAPGSAPHSSPGYPVPRHTPGSAPHPSPGYPGAAPLSVSPLAPSPGYPVPSRGAAPLPVSPPRRSPGYPVPRHVSLPRVRHAPAHLRLRPPMSAGAPPHHQYMQALMAAQGAAHQRELQLQAEAHQRELELTRRVAALEARAELQARRAREPLTTADAMQSAFARAMGPPQQPQYPQHPQHPQPYSDDVYGYYPYQ